jgi:O-antigen biosynthesis protein
MNLPILMYHSISDKVNSKFQHWSMPPSTFAAHMSYLKRSGYTPLTVTQLVQAMTDTSISMPAHPVAITFDDAIGDFMSGAFPTLMENSFPATLYVPTFYVGKQSAWLSSSGEGDRPMMTWEDLIQVDQMGIECGGHSHRHYEMDTLSKEETWQEIIICKNLLEQHLGHAVESFAYPHGYHSTVTARLVKKAGFTSACGVKHMLATTEDNPFSLARIIVSPDVDPSKLEELMQGKGLVKSQPNERIRTKIWRIVRQTKAQFRRRLNPDQHLSSGGEWSQM